MKVLDIMVDFYKIIGKSQNVHMQIWVTWASKITFKNLQLCSIKIKGSHTPCDVTCTGSIYTTSVCTVDVITPDY